MPSLAICLAEKFQDDREKIERYAAVANFCPIPAFIVSSDTREIVYINPAYEVLTGRTLEELRESDWINLVIHPDDRPAVHGVWNLFHSTTRSAPHWHRYISKNGTVTDSFTILECVQGNGFVGYVLPQCVESSCPITRLNDSLMKADCDCNKVVSLAGISPATSPLGKERSDN
jgi:PAS domain S-box-containing protein